MSGFEARAKEAAVIVSKRLHNGLDQTSFSPCDCLFVHANTHLELAWVGGYGDGLCMGALNGIQDVACWNRKHKQLRENTLDCKNNQMCT
jgi:hypothetical protein